MMCAQRMVREGLYHPALIHHSMGTALHHAQELRSNRFQPGDPPFHILQLAARDPVGLIAGLVGLARQRLQGPQIVQPKTHIPAMPDEAQPLQMGLAIASLPSGRPRRRVHPADGFRIADGGNLDAGQVRQPANRQI